MREKQPILMFQVCAAIAATFLYHLNQIIKIYDPTLQILGALYETYAIAAAAAPTATTTPAIIIIVISVK